MTTTPCANLIATAPPTCDLGRNVPADCAGCSAYHPGIHAEERTRCEVWTRVMGYHRPVAAFNAGKQAEHAERRPFRERPVSYGEGCGHD